MKEIQSKAFFDHEKDIVRPLGKVTKKENEKQCSLYIEFEEPFRNP